MSSTKVVVDYTTNGYPKTTTVPLQELVDAELKIEEFRCGNPSEYFYDIQESAIRMVVPHMDTDRAYTATTIV